MSIAMALLGAFGLRRKDKAVPVTVVEATPQPAKIEDNQLSKPEVVKPAKPPMQRKVIATHILAHKFVRWMQDQKCTGYWLVDEIDELREAFCDRFGYVVPYPVEFRSCLAATPGVTKGQYRLNSWEFLDVQKRTHMNRPTLYKIPNKTVSATISNDFHGQLASFRQDDVACQSHDVSIRQSAGKQVAKKGRRAYPKRKRVVVPQDSDWKSTEIEARKAA